MFFMEENEIYVSYCPRCGETYSGRGVCSYCGEEYMLTKYTDEEYYDDICKYEKKY